MEHICVFGYYFGCIGSKIGMTFKSHELKIICQINHKKTKIVSFNDIKGTCSLQLFCYYLPSPRVENINEMK